MVFAGRPAMATHGRGIGLADLALMAERLRKAATADELSACLGAIARDLGFAFHALVHHADLARPPPSFIFLQNYPSHWVQTYAQAGLHRHDPSQRLAGVRPASFAWAELGHVTPLSRSEMRVLEAARQAGLGEGFTVPLHAPGERAASCSFACERGEPLPHEALPAAEFVAHAAFAALFDLLHPGRTAAAMRFTPRQIDCVSLLAQGKSDWEIGAILGLSENTVTTYLQSARKRIGVARRTQLAVAAVSYGLVGLEDIKSWHYPGS
jgi:LuxR family quorum-sensing system transcriptional regulator CciR